MFAGTVTPANDMRSVVTSAVEPNGLLICSAMTASRAPDPRNPIRFDRYPSQLWVWGLFHKKKANGSGFTRLVFRFMELAS